MRRLRFALLLLACTLAFTARAADTPASEPSASSDAFDVWEFRVLGNTTLSDREIESAVYPFLGAAKTLATVEEAHGAR
jgi:hypothetical protein